jgi:hypothetical protein
MRVISFFLMAAALFAVSPVEPVNRDSAAVALHGYDPVGYFSRGQPVKGKPGITWQWMGATWQFSSEESREAFRKEPGRYAPQFGGYCSWAVSRGYTADVDPEAWKILDGKLYLNNSRSVQEKWEADVTDNIGRANRNWPGLHK